jgi:DNA-binding NtrC family response regulator
VSSRSRSLNRFDKTLLVCSESCEDLEKCLLKLGCKVVGVVDGEMAVFKARREIFDAAVLVSTGKEMDMVETVFNLRDLRRSMPIIIVTGSGGADRNAVTERMVAQSVPNTKVLSLQELKSFFGPAERSERITKAASKPAHAGKKSKPLTRRR